MGDLRTLDSNRESFQNWTSSTNSDRKELMNFDNCHKLPFPINRDGSKVEMVKIISKNYV